jgi:hypothetical protein
LVSPPAPIPTTTAPVAIEPPPPLAVAPAQRRIPDPPKIVLVRATPEETWAPWRSALALCAILLAGRLTLRLVRRRLVVRHLARPFWAETMSQRFSNYWQLALIGLGDAGIRPLPGEPPLALAKRVGIEGIETCATILERVRHGVHASASDLDRMAAASSAVYRNARRKAGFAGRAAGAIRWPLA